MHWEEHCPQFEGGYPALVLSPGEAALQPCVQVLAPQHRRDTEIPERVGWQAVRVTEAPLLGGEAEGKAWACSASRRDV